MTNSPYIEFLIEKIDPLVKDIDENASILDDPLLKLMKKDSISGSDVNEQGRIDLWQSNAKPSVFMGDTWEYTFGDVEEKVGSIKTKKLTIAVQLTQEDYKKMKRDGFVSNKIKKKLESQMKKNRAFATLQVRKWAFGKFPASSIFHDAEFFSPFVKGAGNTIANPNDVGSNIALDLTAVAWSGALQTENNVVVFANAIKNAFVLVDSDSDMELPFTTLYLIVSPDFYQILDTNKDILNATSQQRSDKTYRQDLESAGIIIVKDNQGATYTYADGNVHTSTIMADLGVDFSIEPIDYEDGEQWSDWRELQIKKGETYKFVYEKHKEVEFTFLCEAYDISGTLYKKVLEVTTTPLDVT